MSTTLKTFTLFSLLPEELRLIIWSYALTPHLLPLKIGAYEFSPSHAPSFLYLLGGDPPFEHFTPDTSERPSSPYFTANWTIPSDISSPTLLSVCQESRYAALQAGYKVWKLDNSERKSRDVMWNPKIDAVVLEDAAPIYALDLLEEQFPSEVQEIETLFMIGFWVWQMEKPGALVMPLMRMSKLRDLGFVFDERYDSYKKKHPGDQGYDPEEDGVGLDLFSIGPDLEGALEEAKRWVREKREIDDYKESEWGLRRMFLESGYFHRKPEEQAVIDEGRQWLKTKVRIVRSFREILEDRRLEQEPVINLENLHI